MSLLDALGLKQSGKLLAQLAPAKAATASGGPMQGGVFRAGSSTAEPDGGFAPEDSPLVDRPEPVTKLRITAESTTITAAGAVRLKAWGTYKDGTESDVTMLVTWQSSMRSVVEVDSSGVATVKDASANVSVPIYATDEVSGEEAEFILEVDEAPMLGPAAPPKALKLDIGTRPISIYIADTFAVQVTMHFDDGKPRDYSNRVQWKSSAPKVSDVLSVIARLSFYGFTEGTTEIYAIDPITKIRSNSIKLTVMKRPEPPKPLKTLTRVTIDNPRPQSEWVVGDAFAYKAHAQWSDGSTSDITKQLLWHSTNEAAAKVDKAGRVTVVGIGQVMIQASWDHLPTTASAWRSFQAVVLGKPAKAAPVLPAATKFSKDSAVSLVGNLVQLSKCWREPYVQSGGAYSLTATKNASFDSLLKLLVDGLKKLHPNETKMQARGIWKSVAARFVDVIEQAEAPAIGLDPKDSNAAKDAINELDLWFMTPSKDLWQEIDYLRRITPFGQLSINLTTPEKRRKVDDIVAYLAQYEELQRQCPRVAKQVERQKSLYAEVKKTVKSLAELQKHIVECLSDKARNEAKHYAAALLQGKALLAFAKSQRQRFENANVQLTAAMKLLDADEKSQEARQLREEAAQQAALIDGALSIFKGAMVAAVEGPVAVLELIDVYKDLRTFLGDTPLEKRAAVLEEKADSLRMEALKASLSQARMEVAGAMEISKEAEELLNGLGPDIELLREDAEAAYIPKPGGFDFAKMRTALEATEAARKGVAGVITTANRARIGIQRMQNEAERSSGGRFGALGRDTNQGILRQLYADTDITTRKAESQLTQIDAQWQELREIRVVAHRAIFTGKRPKKKPMGP